MDNKFIIILYLVFGGCCSTTITMESIIKIQKNCGNIILLFQFLFIVITGLISNVNFHRTKNGFSLKMKPRQAPLYKWFVMVLLFFSSSALNNLVFKYNISMPFHIIFRSSSIIMNIVMSRIILKQRYTIQQIVAIFMVTIGIIITTISSSKKVNNNNEKQIELQNFVKGILILIFSSFIGALMTIYQEYMFREYPNSWKECLFYKHLLSLPMFFLLIPQLNEQWNLFRSSPKLPLQNYIPILNLPLSISNIEIQGIWLYVAANIISQYICISSIQKLSSIISSVSLTLILNVRKFVSLLVSVILFKNNFPIWSWIGSIMVFSGVIWYSKITNKLKRKSQTKEEKEKSLNISKKIEL